MDDHNFNRNSLAKVIFEPGGTTEKLRFGQLEILEELGRGAAGVVYKVLQTNLNRIIAIKTMEKTFLSQEEIIRFRTEGKIAAKLAHPNIVHVIDLQETEEAYFLYMDYIDGQTLDAYWKKHDLEWLDLADLLMQICLAIHHAHSKGIVHRDLKPSNVMMNHKGKPYITDFGLAKIMGTQNRLTKMGAIMGTPEYMSPEQAQGSEVDCRADIYSLGAILYEGLCKRPCFSANSSLALIMKIIREQPVAPQEINPEIPKQLQNICLRALQKQKDDRYQTAEDMANDLQNYIEETTECSPSLSEIAEENISQSLRSSQVVKKRRRAKTKRYSRSRYLSSSQCEEPSASTDKAPELSQSQIANLNPKDMRKIKNSVGRRSRQSRKRVNQQWWQIFSLLLIIIILIMIARH